MPKPQPQDPHIRGILALAADGDPGAPYRDDPDVADIEYDSDLDVYETARASTATASTVRPISVTTVNPNRASTILGGGKPKPSPFDDKPSKKNKRVSVNSIYVASNPTGNAGDKNEKGAATATTTEKKEKATVMKGPIVRDPAVRHVDELLGRLYIALLDNPAHPGPTLSASEAPVTNDNNVSWMSRFVADTQTFLRQKVPITGPGGVGDGTTKTEKDWDEACRRCAFIDWGINENVGELDAITGQFPGETNFQAEEKELARFLVQGIEDFRVEY